MKTDLFAFSPAPVSWTRWPSGIRTKYRAWTDVTTRFGKKRYSRHWELITDVGESNLLKKMEEEPVLHLIKASYQSCSNGPDLLQDDCLSSSLQKRGFLQIAIDYLGQVIRLGHLSVSTRMISAIRGLDHPTSVMELWSSLGVCKVTRNFVPILPALPRCWITSFAKAIWLPLADPLTTKLLHCTTEKWN